MFVLGVKLLGTPSDSGHETGFETSGTEHLPDDEASAGFAIGAGNSDDAKSSAGKTIN